MSNWKWDMGGGIGYVLVSSPRPFGSSQQRFHNREMLGRYGAWWPQKLVRERNQREAHQTWRRRITAALNARLV